MSRRGSGKNPGEEFPKTPGDGGKRRRFDDDLDDSGIAQTPAQNSAQTPVVDEGGAAMAGPGLFGDDDEDADYQFGFRVREFPEDYDPESRFKKRRVKKDIDPPVVCPYAEEIVPYPSEMPAQRSIREKSSEIFSGNVVLGENHENRGCKAIVEALVDSGRYKVFILEQLTKDLQGDLDSLLKGSSVDDLPKIKALCKRLEGGHEHGSSFKDMLSAFRGKWDSGIRAYALDRAEFDYGRGGSTGGPRVVGMNKDCEEMVKELLEQNGDEKKYILAGKCVVFCGNGHVGKVDEYSEPGISARLNSLMEGGNPKDPKFFQGIHIRDVFKKIGHDVLLVGDEFVAIFPQESEIACSEKTTHANCVLAVNPDLKKDGLISKITKAVELPVITSPEEVNDLFKKYSKEGGGLYSSNSIKARPSLDFDDDADRRGSGAAAAGVSPEFAAGLKAITKNLFSGKGRDS